MNTRHTLVAFAMALVAALPAVAQDKAGCKDDPLFPTRMPNYYISKCDTKEFDFHDFFTVKPPKKRVEGEVTKITYVVDKRENERSALEVVRNYENAIKKIGGTIQGTKLDWWVNGTIRTGGADVWAEVQKGNGTISLTIVRPKAMDQLILADAASLASDLKATGHVSVQGIYFDTAKALLKPESTQAVGEVAKLLKNDASLKLFVVGHTDTVGTVEANLKLSQERAEAVVQALIKDHGIAATRLRSFGNGPFAPVSTNATDDGKALNRRVELVKQ